MGLSRSTQTHLSLSLSNMCVLTLTLTRFQLTMINLPARKSWPEVLRLPGSLLECRLTVRDEFLSEIKKNEKKKVIFKALIVSCLDRLALLVELFLDRREALRTTLSNCCCDEAAAVRAGRYSCFSISKLRPRSARKERNKVRAESHGRAVDCRLSPHLCTHEQCSLAQGCHCRRSSTYGCVRTNSGYSITRAVAFCFDNWDTKSVK